jgi:hypothetical protein
MCGENDEAHPDRTYTSSEPINSFPLEIEISGLLAIVPDIDGYDTVHTGSRTVFVTNCEVTSSPRCIEATCACCGRQPSVKLTIGRLVLKVIPIRIAGATPSTDSRVHLPTRSLNRIFVVAVAGRIDMMASNGTIIADPTHLRMVTK